jgi:hypothetical protein
MLQGQRVVQVEHPEQTQIARALKTLSFCPNWSNRMTWLGL